MPPLSFSLSAADVAQGVERREVAHQRHTALQSIPSCPLVRPSAHEPSARASPGAPSVADGRLTLRFAPAPTHPVPAAAALATRGSGLTFSTLLAVPATAAVATASAVERLAPQPLASVAAGFRRSIESQRRSAEDCERFLDQYSVPETDGEQGRDGCGRCLQVAYATMFHQVPEGACVDEVTGVVHLTDPGTRFSPLLGLTGHVERFSVWSHVFGSVLFALYALLRSAFSDGRNPSDALVAAAAWTAAFTFACSSLYHATSPDREISTFTRVVDYVGIYIGIVVTALADISVVTRGFRNVPLIAILDIPIGAVAISLFFLWRRVRIPRHVTWQADRASCTMGLGLFYKSHYDQHHAPLREATTFLLALSYFMVVPAAVATLGTDTAVVVLGLQGSGFLLLVLGMVIDRVLGWPDSQLVEGRMSWLACRACRCVMTTHGLWHVIAVLAAVVGAVAREYALATV